MRVSVVVASLGRPAWLARCVTALRQCDFPPFEIVLVSDDEGHDAVSGPVKRVRFARPHLAEARNAGIAAAGGDVLAFIDDDAVPEPTWLRHHADALEATGADATAGRVRGRNGISYQWQAGTIDAEAETRPLDVAGAAPFVPGVTAGRALKLVGTNMAVRRAALEKVRGFDPAFAFYLEDADLSLRLADAGMALAVAPRAEVHHGFAASARRTGNRVPRALGDIGRSTAIFFRRHGTPLDEEMWRRLEARERARMLRHLIAGTIEPRDVAARLDELRDGWVAGRRAELPALHALPPRPPFEPAAPNAAGSVVVAARLPLRRRALAECRVLAAEGRRVSFFSFSLTSFNHRVRFVDGLWVQTGGLFGRSRRDGPMFRWCRFASRLSDEMRRVAIPRGLSDDVPVRVWRLFTGRQGAGGTEKPPMGRTR